MKASRFDASEESDACSSIEPVAGLSHTQVPIWVGQQLDPDSPLYNMAFTFVVDGEIDVARFKRAWRRIVDSNSILRTSFRDEDGRGIPFVLPPGSCEIETIDLSDRDDPRQSFRDLAGERAATTLPLDGELVDAVLARLRPSRFGFYLNQHHLITDAASTELLLRRLSEEYLDRSSCNVDEATGPEPYEVTIERLATYAPEAHRQEASQHWLDLQSGPDRSTPFYGRSIEPRSTRNTRRTLELDTNQSDRLREISRDPGFLSLTPEISLFAVFSTLLTAWLHRISGRRQLGFDAPVHNRPTSAAKNSLGLFIEMFPFAVDVEEGASFRSLGEKCLAEAQRFLRAALPATSSTSKVGSNNVVLNFFPGQLGGFAGMPTRVEWIHPGHADKHHGLRLQAHDFEGSGRFTLQFDANDEVFDAAPHIRSVEYFTKLLDAFLDDPDQTIAGVEILTEAERSAMLTEFNRTDSEPLPRLTVSEMIRLQADRTPDRIALRQRNRELRYGELDRAVEARAAELVALGLSPGNRVAVFMTRSIEAVVAILAILRAGGIYVPIDSKFPEARVRQIVADSDASLVLVTGDRVSKLDTLDAQAVVLGIDGIAGATEPGPEPTMPSTLDLAYLIYTSGSTGKPKGVPVSHGGLADYLEWASRQYVRNDELVFPLFTSLAFDLTVTSLYLPLITGGTLVIYEEPDGPVDTSLIDMVGENAVDFVKLTPSHLSLLREMDLADSRIGRMVVGGEDFRTSLAAKIYQQFDGKIEIYNEYGPTEAVVGCMIHRFDPSVDRDSRVPIGRPAEHVQIFLLNEERTPVPEGVPAELCISRYGLSQGYWNRESLTRRQFVDHPFASTGRLYRTGDRARFARPGSLEYLGRIDRQLKVSGFRVEPSEIESALRAHPEIDDCVVTGWSLRAAESHWARHPDYCRRCGLPSNYPGVEFDSRGVCGICISYEAIKDRADAYFRDLDALTEIFEQSAAHHDAPYDCMMLLSGGKDSTYALCRLVDMGLKVYAFSFDNGYISEQAIANVKRVVESLGVDHEIATTPAMNEIFRDSLIRFSNVCNGCFKTIYTLSLTRAHEMGIPIVVTGLSRGQFFETRLAEGLFREGVWSPDDVDRAVLEARKAYHRLEDQVSRSLDVDLFRSDQIFEEIQVVDFYRYCDVGLDEVLSYLEERVPWIRPSDTGRSTNCLINDVGIYIHQKERGFHNYGLPYSWDVRMGHKNREAAIEELNDDIDLKQVRKMLSEVAYDEDRLAGQERGLDLVGYYVASRDIPYAELQRFLAQSLPEQLIPRHLVRIDSLPMTPHGKIDYAALPSPRSDPSVTVEDLASLTGPVQQQVAAIWRTVLGVGKVGPTTSFFDLGGNSLAAMEVTLQLRRQFAVDLPLQTLFQHPSVEELADVIEATIVAEITALSDAEADRLASESH